MRWELEPAERSVWVDLVNFAKKCKTEGVIQTSDDKPYPLEALARRFNVPMELLTATIDKCVAQNRIHRNENGLVIMNWPKYQGRQPIPKLPVKEAITLPLPEPLASKHSFDEWLKFINGEANKPGALFSLLNSLFPEGRDSHKDSARLASLMKRSNDVGYLAKVIWETATIRPIGDVLNYIEGRLRKGGDWKTRRAPSSEEEIVRDLKKRGKI